MGDNTPDYPWDDMHHRSYFLLDESSSNTATQFAVESKDFLPPLDRLEHEDFREILSQRVGSPMIPLSSPGQMDDGNMVNMTLYNYVMDI